MKLELFDNEKILVVAPHPDDESIGCGGLLNKFSGKCDVLLVTDGVSERPHTEDIIKQRNSEFISAMDVCGVDNYIFLHIPAFKINCLFYKFKSVDFSPYKYIFVPNRYEYHKDHIDTYKSIKKILRKKHIKTNLIEYEVWTTLRYPNIFLDIEDVKEQKVAAINQHKSQTDSLDYENLIIGLNTYRGLSKNMQCAEAFYCEKEKNQEKIRSIKRKIKRRIKGK